MKKLISLVLVTILVLTACSTSTSSTSNETFTVEHELGTTEVPVNPKNVVIFDSSTIDTISVLGGDKELGIENLVMPEGLVPSYVSNVTEYDASDVGSLKEPNVEAINATSPDLIIISGRQADYYDQFSEIAPTLYLAADKENYEESVYKNAEIVGQIFGAEDKAKEAIAELKTKSDDLKSKNEESGYSALVTLYNEGQFSAYGEGSRFGIVYELGQTSVAEGLEESTHGAQISSEYIYEQNPDILYILDRGAVVNDVETNHDEIENDVIKKTTAYENGNIIYINPEAWYIAGSGLLSYDIMLDEMLSVYE